MHEMPEIGLNPSAIFEMATGFWVSKVLMCAVELELFTKLSGKSLTINQIQNVLGIQRRQARAFISALSALDLLMCDRFKQNGKSQFFSNSLLADTYLVRGKPQYMGDFIIMYDKRLFKKWDELLSILKSKNRNERPIQSTGLSSLTEKIPRESLDELYEQALHNEIEESLDRMNDGAENEMNLFVRAMYGEKIWDATVLCKIYDFSQHRKLIDLGGGPAVFPIQIVTNFPDILALVIDTKPVCRIANEYIERFNLQSRIKTMALDFTKEDLPKGYDVILISHIIGGINKDKCMSLLKKAYDSLPESGEGTIIINEWLLNDDMTGPPLSALMGLNMVVETNEGMAYSFAEIHKMLSKTGFNRIEKRQIAGSPGHVIIGHKQSKKE
jgi:hypothetical protein